MYNQIIEFLSILFIFSRILVIFLFPWLIAYFYRKFNYIPWSVWEKNPNTKIYNRFVACQSDFKRNVNIL